MQFPVRPFTFTVQAANSTGSDTTQLTIAVAKAAGATVTAPTLAYKTRNSITIRAVDAPDNGQAIEYAISTTDTVPAGAWQPGTNFTGLNANTTYYLFARAGENGYYMAGAASAPLTVTTDDYAVTFISFILNTGEHFALFRTVDLNYTVSNGTPTHYRAAESKAALNSAAWQLYTPNPTYTFADDMQGEKTVYTQLKNSVAETEVKNASIFYKPVHPKESTPNPANVPVSFTATLYPNPVENIMHVRVEGATTSVEVAVYSITGTRYLSQTFNGATFSVDLSACPAGLLLVRVDNGGQYVVKQLIKQ